MGAEIVDFKETRCGVCKKRKATRFCDFVVGYPSIIFFRDPYDFKNQVRFETCDLPMCEECTHKVNSHDFCPHHKKLLSAIKPTKEMETEINRYRMKQLQESREDK